MCCHVYMIKHVKHPYLSIVRVGHSVPLAGFCLPLCSLHVLNRDFSMIQPINQQSEQGTFNFGLVSVQCYHYKRLYMFLIVRQFYIKCQQRFSPYSLAVPLVLTRRCSWKIGDQIVTLAMKPAGRGPRRAGGRPPVKPQQVNCISWNHFMDVYL